MRGLVEGRGSGRGITRGEGRGGGQTRRREGKPTSGTEDVEGGGRDMPPRALTCATDAVCTPRLSSWNLSTCSSKSRPQCLSIRLQDAASQGTRPSSPGATGTRDSPPPRLTPFPPNLAGPSRVAPYASPGPQLRVGAPPLHGIIQSQNRNPTLPTGRKTVWRKPTSFSLPRGRGIQRDRRGPDQGGGRHRGLMRGILVRLPTW